jgi:hypothetical protein
MKMNNKNIFKVVLIFLLIGMIGTFTHCVPQIAKEIGNGGGSSNNSTYSGGGSNTPKDEGQIINEIQVTTGVKNHEQILHTMGAVTGIDPYSNTGIINVYRQVEMSLPTDNDIKIFSSTQQVAVTKLAAEFCAVLTSDGARRALIWPNLNFGGSTATVFANPTVFIDQTLSAFWGPVVSDEEIDAAHDDLMALITMLNTQQSGLGAPTTTNTVRGVCTAVLSSAYITLI